MRCAPAERDGGGRSFEEMPTNNFVESSFWNFDALFQPQQHPARDSHDTFFLKCPHCVAPLSARVMGVLTRAPPRSAVELHRNPRRQVP
jgi:phenylalanyl-tRNA synthetase alpha subunit